MSSVESIEPNLSPEEKDYEISKKQEAENLGIVTSEDGSTINPLAHLVESLQYMPRGVHNLQTRGPVDVSGTTASYLRPKDRSGRSAS